MGSVRNDETIVCNSISKEVSVNDSITYSKVWTPVPPNKNPTLISLASSKRRRWRQRLETEKEGIGGKTEEPGDWR